MFNARLRTADCVCRDVSRVQIEDQLRKTETKLEKQNAKTRHIGDVQQREVDRRRRKRTASLKQTRQSKHEFDNNSSEIDDVSPTIMRNRKV